jgi:hypothetical protein
VEACEGDASILSRRQCMHHSNGKLEAFAAI